MSTTLDDETLAAAGTAAGFRSVTRPGAARRSRGQTKRAGLVEVATPKDPGREREAWRRALFAKPRVCRRIRRA
jgi:hypothetical protein